MEFQGVVLCCDDPRSVHPLTSDGSPICLLPLLTRPILWYPLRSFKDANVDSVLIVLREASAASQVRTWLSKENALPTCEVLVADDAATDGDALRLCLPRLSCRTAVVTKLGSISEVPMMTLVAHHCVRNAEATIVLRRRTGSASSQTKPGRSPEGVDYIGLDNAMQHLLFLQSSPDTIKSIKVPGEVMDQHLSMTLTTDYLDAGMYVLSREAVMLIKENASWTDLSSHLLPYLIRHPSRSLAENGDDNSESKEGTRPSSVSVFFPGSEEYVSAITSARSFSDVTKDLMGVRLRTGLVGLPSGNEAFVMSGAQLDAKATVSGSSLVCEGTRLCENAAVKRSFVGRNCRIGASCKIVNSVLLDHVSVDDYCHIQSSVLAKNCKIGASSQIKDSYLGPGVQLTEKTELNEETMTE